MFSTIPKLANKAFIVGFLPPVILFLAACYCYFLNLQFVSNNLNVLMSIDNIEKIIYVFMLV